LKQKNREELQQRKREGMVPHFSPLKNVFFENEQTEQRGNPYFLSKTKITMVQDENDNNRRQVMVKG